MSKKKSILLLIILFSCICGSAEAKTIYVDASASSCGDGLSWVTAYKYLQDALEDANASPDCNIYVAEGTYNPDQNCANPGGTGDRMATFQLINDVAIYGGFPTGGCAWNDRNWDMNETILSGDLLGNDVVVADPCELLNDPCRAENSYHVVTGSNTDETAILDGFTITAGNANDPNYSVAGGGMYNDSGSPTVKNCTFKRNSAHGGYDGHSYQGGGGMYNYYHNIYERGPTITDCKFIENWSECGGGMCNNYYSEPTLTNCVFTGNSAEDGGGMSNHYRDPTLTNCTFTDNSAVDNGGGIYNGSSEPTLTNCILWDNSPEQIAGYGTATVTYSDVEGGWCGVGNIDEDPMLEPDGYHLTEGSPCIEAGDPYYVAGPDETDIDGEDRIMYGSYDFKVAIDMGADEFYLSDYFVLEDFERYADSSSLKQVWHGTGGADVNISTGLCDRIVPYQRHTGEKAMAFDYNNALPPYYSEAYANTTGLNSLDFRSDWVTGVNTLSLWFHGIEDLRGNHSATEPYDVNGDGLGIYNTTCDSFYYFYREKTGQITGLVTARVDSIEDTDPLAMAGVMMRDKLTDNCKYAATVVTPDDRLIFMYRDSTTGRALASLSGISMPHWVGIACAPPYPARTIATHANDVDGHPDKWTQIGNDVYGGLGSAPLYLGLCVTSNSYGDMCKAKFAQVDVNSPIPTRIGDPCEGKDIGIVYHDNDPEPMYVGLKDNYGNSAFETHPDPNATLIGDWEQWLIDLNIFHSNGGVDLNDVNMIYIGFGDRNEPNAGGSGLVYFDDIGLFEKSICEPPPTPASIAYPDSNCGGSYTVKWAESERATSYELWRSKNGEPNELVYNDEPNFYNESDLDCGNYRYRVKACNHCGCSDPCEGGDCIVTELAPDIPISITYPDSNCGGSYPVCWEPPSSSMEPCKRVTYYELDVNVYDGGNWSGWEPVQGYNGTDTCYDENVSSCGIYRYRVKACNACGCSDPCEGGNCIVAITAPAQPPSITYSESNCGDNYQVCWTAVSCAASYELERSSCGENDWSLIYSGPDICCNESVSDCNNYLYRVRALNVCGYSNWCTGDHCCLVAITPPAQPCPITYPDSNCGGNYEVCWEAVSCATSYEVDVNDGGGWVQDYNGPDTCYDANVSICGNYRYRVKAWNVCGWSDYCEGGVCIVAITAPAQPPSITYSESNCGDNYQVCWTAVSCAASYELERSSCGENDWSLIYSGPDICCNESVSDCNNYLYRVRALNVCGYSNWCTGDHCCLVAITPPAQPCPITYPTQNCGGNYEVCWEAVSCAMSYEVDVNDGSGWVQDYKGPNTCYNESVSDCNNYCYRVRALNVCGYSGWCIGDHNCVVELPLEAPADIDYPDSNCGGNYPVCWTAVSCAASYELEHSKNGGGWVQDYNGPNTCYDESVSSCGYYRYRVKACNTICGCSDWFIGDHNCAVATSKPNAPGSITYYDHYCVGSYTVVWEPSSCATYYELYIDSGSGWPPEPNCSVPDPCCEFENVEPGVYSYCVRACNVCGCSDDCCAGGDCVVSRTPEAPDNIWVPLSDDDGEYDVNWAASAGAVSYQLESKTDYTPPCPTPPCPCPYGWVLIYSGPNTTYNEWVGGGTWSYRVRAVDETGLCPSAWTYSLNSCEVNDCFPGCKWDYDEWQAVRYPPCWCYPRQCYGDVDNAAEGGTKTGYNYVHFNDLSLLLDCWDIKEPNCGNPYPGGPGAAWHNPCICADFCHDVEGGTKTGYYRVHFCDLTILLSSWNILEPNDGNPYPGGPGIDPNCLDCP